MAEIYYVYEHIRLDTNQVFYVGKGKNKRCYSNKNRNKHWHNITEKHGYSVNIIVENVDEELSFLIEKELISKYKKLNQSLVNYTDGGEGFSGAKHTQETRDKMSLLKLGKPTWNKGVAFSEETKNKMSNAKLGKPPHNKGKLTPQSVKDKMSLAKMGVFKNKKWWTNGIVNKRSEECPGIEWYNGQVRNNG